MSIFLDIHPKAWFDSIREFEEVERMLSEAIGRGHVEKVPVMNPDAFTPDESWYQDRNNGEIYSLKPPNFPARGAWQRIDPKELERSDFPTQ
jgi:hypothetical protein